MELKTNSNSSNDNKLKKEKKEKFWHGPDLNFPFP